MVSKVTTLALKTIQFFISRGKKTTAIVYVKQLYIYFKVNNLQSLSIKLTGETILSLAKECPLVEHLTSLPKRVVGDLSSGSTFKHERVPMSCLQRLNALKAKNWTSNNM